MSSKDNKPDLSNLKSRLGLKKSGGGTDKSSGEAKKKTTGSGGQSTLGGSKKPQRGGKKGSGGVDDRLAALKQSKLKSSKKEQPQPEPQQAAPQASSQASAPAAGGRDSGGFDEFDAATQSQHSGASAQPDAGGGAGQGGGGGRRHAGPPPGAQGPPPTAMAPPPTQRQSASTASSQQTMPEDDEELDLKDFDLDDGGIFSPATIVVLVAVLVGGLMFGFLASDSLDARAVQQSRIDDARSLQADLEPKVEDFERAREIVQELVDAEMGEVDFEAAEELAQLDFVINARVLPRERMLMADSSIVGPLNQVMGNSDALYRLILEHYKITTGADREELEAFVEASEELDDNEEIAALYSLQGWGLHLQDDQTSPKQFNPSPGALVRVPVREDFDAEEEEASDDPRSRFEVDEDGMITVEFVTPSEHGEPGTTHEAFIYDLVPINQGQFMQIERNNAVQRYHNRIRQMRDYSDQLARQLRPLQEAVDEVASEEVPLFSIGSTVDAPADHDDEDFEVEQAPAQEEAAEEPVEE